MAEYQTGFIKLAIEAKALSFGEFTLKSGRVSPYFFNAGQFQTGSSLAQLGSFYAQALVESGVHVDMVFGPAYKGIPLAAVTVAALAEQFNRDLPYCFNRKEKKDHGEGGQLVGAPLKGKVVIVDDVITAGTAMREALSIIESSGAEPAAIVVGLDRQERGVGNQSAICELEEETGVQVISIANMSDIINYLTLNNDKQTLQRVKNYREKYGT